MLKLSKDDKTTIDNELYKQVKAIIESEYNEESVINPEQRDSKRLIFKDRKKAIRMVADYISVYANENNFDKIEVMNFLLELLERDIKRDNMFKPEYIEAQRVITEAEEYEEEIES